MNELTLTRNAKLIDAVKVLENSSKRLAVVLSDDNKVIGTLTDGDVRRAILADYTMNSAIVDVMHDTPIVAQESCAPEVLIELLKRNNIRSLPLINEQGNFTRICHQNELLDGTHVKPPVSGFSAGVIMAGGEGRRLRPLTENLPKPMIEIDGIPLLERQVCRFKEVGIKHVFLSVNYLSEVITEYFGDGSRFGVNIAYLKEDKKMGTAGALSLLPELKENGPIIVMNGDVLTSSDFLNLYHFHQEHQPLITVSAVNYHVNIPYGVINCDGSDVVSLQEKPSQRFFCNAGIYALSQEVMKAIPADSFYNMTDLIEDCLKQGNKVSVFPLHEYWTDIGTPSDLEKARIDFKGICK